MRFSKNMEVEKNLLRNKLRDKSNAICIDRL